MHKSFKNHSKVIEKIRSLGGEARIFEVLEEVARLKILVVGEPIIDTYRFCVPENISSKSPSISARFQYEENYQGGSLAIVRHLSEFVNSALFLKPKDFPDVQKIRYVALQQSQRIFEITHLPNDSWTLKSPREFCDMMIAKANEADLVIIADFGHRLFEGEVLDALFYIRSFLALNVQTNSSNFGFNVFKKHVRFDYLSLDLREAKLAYHDRNSTADELLKKLKGDLKKPFSVTLGRDGACYHYIKDHHCPSFVKNIVDATGAGDAYFALTSCLVKVGCEPELILFLGNIFAGLKTKIIGNKEAVSKASFLKAISTVLKSGEAGSKTRSRALLRTSSIEASCE